MAKCLCPLSALAASGEAGLCICVWLWGLANRWEGFCIIAAVILWVLTASYYGTVHTYRVASQFPRSCASGTMGPSYRLGGSWTGGLTIQEARLERELFEHQRSHTSSKPLQSLHSLKIRIDRSTSIGTVLRVVATSVEVGWLSVGRLITHLSPCDIGLLEQATPTVVCGSTTPHRIELWKGESSRGFQLNHERFSVREWYVLCLFSSAGTTYRERTDIDRQYTHHPGS